MNQLKNISIFLADDDEDDCILFQDALSEVEGETDLIISSDGEQLMTNLDELVPPEPRIIFLDLNMPRKNGFECLEEIRQSDRFKDIPVIILSTSSQHESIRRAYAHGANSYITKPGTFSLLKKTIREVLAIDWKNTARPSLDAFIFRT